MLILIITIWGILLGTYGISWQIGFTGPQCQAALRSRISLMQEHHAWRSGTETGISNLKTTLLIWVDGLGSTEPISIGRNWKN